MSSSPQFKLSRAGFGTLLGRLAPEVRLHVYDYLLGKETDLKEISRKDRESSHSLLKTGVNPMIQTAGPHKFKFGRAKEAHNYLNQNVYRRWFAYQYALFRVNQSLHDEAMAYYLMESQCVHIQLQAEDFALTFFLAGVPHFMEQRSSIQRCAIVMDLALKTSNTSGPDRSRLDLTSLLVLASDLPKLVKQINRVVLMCSPERKPRITLTMRTELRNVHTFRNIVEALSNLERVKRTNIVDSHYLQSADKNGSKID